MFMFLPFFVREIVRGQTKAEVLGAAFPAVTSYWTKAWNCYETVCSLRLCC